MSQFQKRAHESAADSVAKNPKTSDERVFTEAWKTKTRFFHAILLTATRAYVGDHDKIIVYDTATRQEIGKIAPGGGYICYILQSRDGKSLFVACSDGTARIINLDTGKEAILRGHTDAIRCIIQDKGTDVLTCSRDKTVRRWNSLTGECLKVYKGHTDWVASILYDEATKRIFSASFDMTIIVWNGETGEKIGVIEGHRDWVRSLARVNSTTIASGSGDGTIKLWNMATLACIKTISNDSHVRSVVATPDGQYLISGSDDGNVKVWSVATSQCLHTLSHHSHWALKVAVSPDGRFIASGGIDNMFHLFSVSPPFSFAIRESVHVHDGREKSLSLFSDGAISGSNGDLIAAVTSTSTCSIVSEKRFAIHGSVSVEFAAPSASAAQLWAETIGAVAADLALHPDDRASSAEQMIRRYRFNLLQTIIFHNRDWRTRKWCISREIAQIIGGYIT
jgi:WD40 repeat protein